MSVAILNPNYYWYAPFIVPQNKTVVIDMESGAQVDMYVLWNEQELEAFKQGQRPYHRAALGIMNYYNKVNLASLSPAVSQVQPALASTIPSQTSGLAFLSGFFAGPLPGSTWYLVIVNRPGNQAIPIFYRVYNA